MLPTIAGILGMCANIPQAYKLHKTNDCKGISITTFSIVVLITLCWTLHGIYTKDKGCIITHIIGFFVALYIVLKILFIKKYS